MREAEGGAAVLDDALGRDDDRRVAPFRSAAPRAVDSRAAAPARRRPAAQSGERARADEDEPRRKMVGDPARQREDVERAKFVTPSRRVEQHHVERQVAGGALQRGDVVDLRAVLESPAQRSRRPPCESRAAAMTAPRSRSAAVVSSSWDPISSNAVAGRIHQSDLLLQLHRIHPPRRLRPAARHARTEARAAARPVWAGARWCTCRAVDRRPRRQARPGQGVAPCDDGDVGEGATVRRRLRSRSKRDRRCSCSPSAPSGPRPDDASGC